MEEGKWRSLDADRLGVPTFHVGEMVTDWEAAFPELLPLCLPYFAANSLNTLPDLRSVEVRAVIGVTPEAGSWFALCLIRLHASGGCTQEALWPTASIPFQPDSEAVPAETCAVLVTDGFYGLRHWALVDAASERGWRDFYGLETLLPGGEMWTSEVRLPEGWSLAYRGQTWADGQGPLLIERRDEGTLIVLKEDSGTQGLTRPLLEGRLYRVLPAEAPTSTTASLTAYGPEYERLLLTFHELPQLRADVKAQDKA